MDMHLFHYLAHCRTQGEHARSAGIGTCAASAWDAVMSCKAWQGYDYAFGFNVFLDAYLNWYPHTHGVTHRAM